MNPPDAGDQQRMILAQLGMSGDEDFRFLVAQFWAQNTTWAAVNPRLQYLYTFRDAVSARVAALSATSVDWTGEAGVASKDSQKVTNLRALLAPDGALMAEIAVLTQQAGIALGTSSGEILKQAPIEPCAGYPDPNSRAFRGDPVVRRPRT